MGTKNLTTEQFAGRAQYYVFQMAGQELVMVEAFDDLGHHVVPSPFVSVAVALVELERLHPGAIVDSLCYQADIDEATSYALSQV
jgi:hypothetical protein